MAFTSSPTDGRFNDVASIETAATTTGTNDVHGAAATLYSVDIDNAATQDAYVKFYDAVTSVVTDLPILILKVIQSTRRVFVFPDGIAFSSGITYRCVNAGGTAGATTPTGGNCSVTCITS